ncbi:hypothetical protein IPM65_06790 [Candidatus Roizmanbacteria bacterium]|nr:MAG: hypothetical protein IPM65_06790 [Candidatus Roizmanbacteria bacterium]
MDTYLTIIQYQSEADQVMLVKNSSNIFFYEENPETGINVMIAVVDSNQLAALLAKGYIVPTVTQSPNMNNYDLIQLDYKGQESFYAKAGDVFLISDTIALVRYDEGISRQQIGESEDSAIIPFIDIRKDLAEKNNITETELANEVITPSVSPAPAAEKNQSSDVSYVYIGAIIIFVLLIVIAFVYYHKTKATDN